MDAWREAHQKRQPLQEFAQGVKVVRTQAQPVAFSVETFMMSCGIGTKVSESRYAAKNLAGIKGMEANGPNVLRCEFPGFSRIALEMPSLPMS